MRWGSTRTTVAPHKEDKIGLSSKKTKQTVNNTQTQDLTRTPTNPPFVSGALQDYTNLVRGAFNQGGPASIQLPTNDLQNAAANASLDLGDSPAMSQGQSFANGVAMTPPMYSGGAMRPINGYAPLDPRTGMTSNIGQVATPQAVAQQPAAPQNFTPSPQRTMSDYVDGPFSSSNFQPAAPLRRTSFANTPELGDPSQMSPAQLAEVERAQAASVANRNIGDYMNPYLTNVYETAMDDFESYAGRQRAQQAARMAGSGAFGSRAAIREAQTEGELARARNSMSAGLLADGYNRAMGFAEADTGRQQDVNTLNANAANTFALQQGGFDQQAGLANQGANNQFALSQADLEAGANQFNAGLGENARQFGAGLRQNNNQFNSSLHAGALDRQLAAAGLLGNMGMAEQENMRANIATANNVGNQRYAVDYANQIAPYNYLSLYGDLLGKGQYPLFQGQTQAGTVNTRGQTTTRQGSSLLDVGLGIGSMFL